MLIRTRLDDSRGIEYEHLLRYGDESEALEVEVTVQNRSADCDITLECLSSFTLGYLTPFLDEAEPGQLLLHRLLSNWSAEGRLKSEPAEELQLEPSWQWYSANTVRFGQRGSMPVREYVPFVAVEDRKAGVTWAAVTTQGSSWQMEITRKDEGLVISGGLADMEFGQWKKLLKPGESFHAPKAVVTVVQGDVTAAAQRIAENVRQYMPLPESERSMPMLFNEFCSTWGHPTQKSITEQLKALKDTGIQYFVIDAGWYISDDSEGDTRLGEWEVGRARFPDGMEETVRKIKEAGMQPGVWFEFEISGADSPLFEKTSWQLSRNGYPITAGKRRFWDFRNEEVREYLAQKVIGFLKRYGFTYLKVDYNGNIGVGCDGAESQGEGLRQQIEAVQAFFDKIHREIPELVIENCASGGHRLVHSFLERTSMSSFSDAHECLEIPIIAANMHRMILPRQSQIWVVLRKEAEISKLYYQISAAMLGRLCVSGDIVSMSGEQREVLNRGLLFYQKVSSIIDRGVTRILGPHILSYRHPEGWQAVIRKDASGSGNVLVVFHTFGNAPDRMEIPLSEEMEGAGYKAKDCFVSPETGITVAGNFLIVEGLKDFQGGAVFLNA